jgi:RNA polymerase sigma-70 factor (sigma-E family)
MKTETVGMGLADLHRAHYRSLVRLAAILLGDAAAAEEVAQDAFAGAMAAAPRIEDPDKLLAYVRQAVVNRARSRLRRRAVASRPWRRTPEAVLPTPEETAVIGARRAAVVEALRTLSARQRECLALRYYLELSDTEVAAALGLSAGSVKQHIARGLANLEGRLEGQDA